MNSSLAGIEGFDIGAHVLGEGAVGEHVLADLVGALADALVMAAHAGDAVGHRAVELTVVEHNLGRALVEAGARRGIQIVGLEAVRQAENGLAAVMLEGISTVRTKRVNEQALLRPVALEVVRRPEIAGGDRVALDQAIMLGHARVLEARALGEELLDVLLHVDVHLLLELGESLRQLQADRSRAAAAMR